MNIFKNFYFKIVFNIVLGLFLGSIVGLVYISSTDKFKLYLQEKISEQFEKDFGCKLSCKVDDIDIVSCSIQLSSISIGSNTKDLTSLDKKSDWSIIAEKLVLQGSYFSLFTHRALKVNLNFDHVIMMEIFEDNPDKLKNFFAKTFGQIEATWILYEAISIKNGMLYLAKSNDELYAQFPYSCQLQSDALATKIQLYLKDGLVWYHQGASIEKISGTSMLYVPFENSAHLMNADISLTYDIHKNDIVLPSFIEGVIRNGKGSISIKSEDGLVGIDPLSIRFDSGHCWCDMQVQLESSFFKNFNMPQFFSDITGNISAQLRFDLYNFLSSLQISLSFQDLLYKNKAIIPGGNLIIKEHDHKGFLAKFIFKEKDLLKVSFKSEHNQKRLHIQNSENIDALSMFGWIIKKDNLVFDLHQNSQGLISGSYKLLLNHQILKDEHLVQGTYKVQDNILTIKGGFGDIRWEIVVELMPEIKVNRFNIYEKNKLIFELNSDVDSQAYLTASADFSFIQKFVPDLFKKSFTQDGSFTARSYIKDGILCGDVQTHYAHIRLPYIYNVIQNITMSYELNIAEKNIVLKNVSIDLHEGSMRCERATFWFNDSMECYFIHMPIIFDKIMMSFLKGIYGLASGRLFISKPSAQESLSLEGKLFLHKSQIHENILSAQFHELAGQMTSSKPQDIPDVKLDMQLMVFDGLEIKTSFMTAKTMIDLMIQGTLEKPRLSGGIQFTQGILDFPYKPLDITGGKVTFIPDQPLDPVIELTARGKLKKYLVTMQAWGTALDPHIKFKSQPYLNEEQILSLLLLGVEDQSLSLMVPAFLTQKLQEIIFGPAVSKSRLKSFFYVILKSFKYVRFLPEFTNQFGRGGMRGVFEINASDNLHGKINTNFSQIEDTKVDIDYDVTDDVTVRLQKDGPSTYGGEVEFGWKFS